MTQKETGLFVEVYKSPSWYNIDGFIGNTQKKLKDWFAGAKSIGSFENSVFKFDIVGEETLKMASDVSDNFVEKNTVYQDQISIKPIEYTITGEIGELVYYKNDNSESMLSAVPEKLTTIASFVPTLSKSMAAVQSKAIKIANFVNSVDNAVSRLKKMTDTASGFQEQAYNELYGLWQSREPVTIKTAWGTLSNYVITNIDFSQRDTVDKSEISITFKQFRTTEMGQVYLDTSKFSQGRLADQKIEGTYNKARKATRNWIAEKLGVPKSVLSILKD